jgi:hypothetical protein
MEIKSKFEEIDDENWMQYGPHLELCVLSYITSPKKWDSKFINNKEIKYEVSRKEDIDNKIAHLTEIVNRIVNNLSEIKIIDNLKDIQKNIGNIFIKTSNNIYINIKVNIGGERRGCLYIENISNSILLIKIFVLDEYDFKCRIEFNKLFQDLFNLSNGFCGTIGLESDVKDIFKIDELEINIGDESNYGIENIYWNKNIKFRR